MEAIIDVLWTWCWDIGSAALNMPVKYYLAAGGTSAGGWALWKQNKRLNAVVEELEQTKRIITVQGLNQSKPVAFAPDKTLIATWKAKRTPELKRLDPEAYAKYDRDIARYGN